MFTSKPVREHISVSDVRPSESINSSHARSSNIVRASNIRLRKTFINGNVCSGKRFYTNYVRPSRPICGSKLCQSKTTSCSNI